MLKKAIESALLAAQSSRQGAKVPPQPQTIEKIMIDLGFMSIHGNLTAKGAAERDKIARRREDEAFG